MNTITADTAAPETTTKPSAVLNIKTILVPLDFSRASMHALKYTTLLAKEFNAAIHLLHVQPVDEFTALPGAGHLMLNCADAIAMMQDRLVEVQDKQKVQFWPDSCHVASGRPYEEICKLAVELDVDLIVLSTRGYSGLKHLALGSTAERVIRYAPCPVLIPRGEKFDRMTWTGEPPEKFSVRKILAPLDFSEASLVGVKYAALLARHFGANLRLFHVIFPYTQVFQMDRLGADLVPLVQNARFEAEKELAKVHALEFMAGVDCEDEVQTGSTIDEICAASGRNGNDLLVIATHGRTGVTHAIMGSIAEHVVRYAESPVLVVPARS